MLNGFLKATWSSGNAVFCAGFSIDFLVDRLCGWESLLTSMVFLMTYVTQWNRFNVRRTFLGYLSWFFYGALDARRLWWHAMLAPTAEIYADQRLQNDWMPLSIYLCPRFIRAVTRFSQLGELPVTNGWLFFTWDAMKLVILSWYSHLHGDLLCGNYGPMTIVLDRIGS